MATGIDLRGADQVLKQFELFNCPFYAVYQGKDLKFYHDSEDIDSAKELLEQSLAVLDYNQSTAVFKIVFYTQLNKDEKLTAENIKGSNTFRVVSPGVSYNNPNFGNPELIGSYQNKRESAIVLQTQSEKIEQLENKIDLLLEAKDDIEEPQSAVGSFQNVIGSLLSNPTIQEALIGRILNFVDTILPEKKQPVQIAGVMDESEVQTALRILFEAGMSIADLQKLANISTNNKPLFTILLSQLRAQ